MTLEDMQHILDHARTIAFVGLSEQPERYSNKVAAYFQSKGYQIVPVNPRASEIRGERAYPSLLDIPNSEQIDIISVFRSSEHVLAHTKEAITRGDASTVWLAEGIHSADAAALAKEQGLAFIENHCIMNIDATRPKQ